MIKVLIKISEEHRRFFALVFAHVGWWGSFVLLCIIISMGGSKPAGKAPPWLGLIFILLMGVGIAAGSALSRMRLSRTIVTAFERGYDMAVTKARAERLEEAVSLKKDQKLERDEESAQLKKEARGLTEEVKNSMRNVHHKITGEYGNNGKD